MKQSNNSMPVTKPRMTYDEKESMLMHILRSSILFTDAKRQLKPEHFDRTHEAHYGLVWKAALELAERTGGKLPAKGAVRRLELQVKAYIESSPDILTAEQEDDLFGKENGFLNWCYEQPAEDIYEQDGRVLLELFLRERTVVDPLKRYMQSTGDDTPLNLPALLREIGEQERKITTVRVSPITSAFPDKFELKKLDFIPTGVPFLDQFMEGQVRGEAYGVLGTTGSGKTSIGIQLAVAGALYEQSIGRGDNWYYFSYESPVSQPDNPEIMLRTWSCAATIERNTLFKGLELSTTGNLKDYEKERWKENIRAGQEVPGEKERLAAMSARLKNNLWLVDMSGLPENPTIGSGGVREIADYLTNEMDAGRRPAGVIIDYVGIAVSRMIEGQGLGFGDLRHHLNDFGDQARRLVAANCNCCVWLMHQLSGDANLKSPTTKMHHAMGAETKSFANPLWFAFNFGSKNAEGVMQMTCSKARRAGSAGTMCPLVKVDGAFSRLICVDDEYMVDGNKIVLRANRNRIVKAGDAVTVKTTYPSPAQAVGHYTSR